MILLDLMKVISHHHARLATPIRSVQRVLDDIEPRGAPFRDTNRSAESQGKPYLLIEASAVASAYRDAEQVQIPRMKHHKKEMKWLTTMMSFGK